ncbi:MAG: hypothetical protein QME94_19770 [Anaerolineae bacterium]|nr:hypothetical protein [Anaerolineae bacterium]
MVTAPSSRRPQAARLDLRMALWPIPALMLTAALLLSAVAGCGSGRVEPGALAFEGPQAYTLKPGDNLPGTDVRFVGRSGDGAEFLIGEQRTVKQKADSLNWSGSPAEGVRLELRLRIVWYTESSLYAAGTARLVVSDVAAQAGQVPGAGALSYQMPAAFTLPLKSTVTGTGLSYEGKSAEGAMFAGIEGYPYRQTGDSLRWEGYLRPNVAVRQDLRLLQYDDRSARLGGVAHLWVTP